jgi:hypothetical protein
MSTLQEQACINDFVKGFTTFMNDNPDVLEEFTEAWHNADNKTIKSIVDDYITELEPQP